MGHVQGIHEYLTMSNFMDGLGMSGTLFEESILRLSLLTTPVMTGRDNSLQAPLQHTKERVVRRVVVFVLTVFTRCSFVRIWLAKVPCGSISHI